MFEPKSFDHLIGTPGFSETMLKNHFTLYQGYVKNTNTLVDTLATFAREGKTAAPEYAELKRRFGWEFNGMRLHELYFGNMSKTAADAPMGPALTDALLRTFGTTDAWLKDFKATGAMRGIGWVVLALDPSSKQLYNIWVNEHDMGHLAGSTLLLVMDVFEHAYVLDYGLKKVDYIDAFYTAIDWNVVGQRCTSALQ